MCGDVQDFAKAGAGGAGMMFTFHLEACGADTQQLSRDAAHPAVVEMCRQVKEAGMKVCSSYLDGGYWTTFEQCMRQDGYTHAPAAAAAATIGRGWGVCWAGGQNVARGNNRPLSSLWLVT
jgi:hypothetical protein